MTTFRANATFEETYPSMPFAALVDLAIWAGRALRRTLDNGNGSAGHAMPAGA